MADAAVATVAAEHDPQADLEDDAPEEQQATATGAASTGAMDKMDRPVEVIPDREVNAQHLQEALAALDKTAGLNERKKREKELAAVVVDPAVVQVLVDQFEITAEAADHHLRLHNGNALAALTALTH